MRPTASTAVALALLLAGCVTAPVPPAHPLPGVLADPARPLPAAGPNAAEPHVAVRADGRAIVVAHAAYVEEDAPGRAVRFDVAISRSLDGGATWDLSFLPEDVLAAADPAGRLRFVGDPVLAYAPDGALYLAGVASDGASAEAPAGGWALLPFNLAVFVTRSDDDGGTWSRALFALAGAGYFGAGRSFDKPWIATSPDGALHLTFTEFVGATSVIRHARSEDGGATWTDPRALALTTPGERDALQGAAVAAGPDGRVVVTATEYPFLGVVRGPSGSGRQIVWSSADGGRTFAQAVPVGPAAYPRFGHVAVDPADGNRVLVAAVTNDATPRAYAAESRDGGATWTTPRLLAEERSGPETHPAVWIGADGLARAAWYDGGWPGGERAVVAVLDADGAARAAAPESPPIDPGRYRREYLGLAGAGERAWAAWVGGSEASGTRIDVASFTPRGPGA